MEFCSLIEHLKESWKIWSLNISEIRKSPLEIISHRYPFEIYSMGKPRLAFIYLSSMSHSDSIYILWRFYYYFSYNCHNSFFETDLFARGQILLKHYFLTFRIGYCNILHRSLGAYTSKISNFLRYSNKY